MTVLDLSTVGPASRCTRLLADFGADVVKVGPVPGRGAAGTEPPFFSYAGGRGTSRVCLDLRDEDARAAFMSLAASADVLIESFRPGVADRLGIGYTAVSARNPKIVYCSTSGYGQRGARSGWAGHDLNYLAVSGFLAMGAAEPGAMPPIPGATVADSAGGGMHAALSIVASLLARASTGVGAYLDVSVADGALWLMSLALEEALATGAQPAPKHDVLSGRYACYSTYMAADGRWLAVASIEPKFFANLCGSLGCEKWVERQYDDDVQEEIRADFDAAFATRDRDSWVATLSATDTCVAPVLEPSEVVSDPSFEQRGVFVEAQHPLKGRFSQLAPVLAGMPAVVEPVTLPDPGATQTEERLLRAGLAAEEIHRLRDKGVAT